MFTLSGLLILISLTAAVGLSILLIKLTLVFKNAPILNKIKKDKDQVINASLSVVIPVFNEEKNIANCLSSVLSSIEPCEMWEVIVVNDNSSDKTTEIAKSTAIANGWDSKRFKLVEAGSRPLEERWVGKNWACNQALDHIKSDWILFLDADVKLKSDTLRRSIIEATEGKADLLSLAPRINCDCLAEWMVQPIMASLLAIGFPIKVINNPKNKKGFAAGPFMLFKRSAYLSIGGHEKVSGEVVEDIALANNIKKDGFKLIFLLALDGLELKMYDNLPALWEGWTKNWFLGLDQNVLKSISASTIVLIMFTGPWIVFFSGIVDFLFIQQFGISIVEMSLSFLAISLQFILRVWSRQKFKLPITYWWLMGAGGLIIGAIGPVSAWKTITGQGWTWKGRNLGY